MNPRGLPLLATGAFGLLLLCFCPLGCGPGREAVARRSQFEPLSQGTPEQLSSHLEALKTRYDSSSAIDPDTARANLDSYTKAVVTTAETLLANPQAASEDLVKKAAESLLSAQTQRMELEPAAAFNAFLETTDRLESLETAAKDLPALVALSRLNEVEIAPNTALEDPSKRFDLLIEAAKKLAATQPPQPQGTEKILRTAQLAEAQGKYEQATQLFEALATYDKESSEASFAPGSIRRLGFYGKELTGISGPDLESKPISLEDFRGKVVLIIFWASHAGASTSQVMGIEGFRRELAKDDFVVLGICGDDKPSAVASTLKSQKIEWPQILIPHESPEPKPSPLAVELGIQQLPHFLLVDREGKLVASGKSGFEMDAKIRELLAPPAAEEDAKEKAKEQPK